MSQAKKLTISAALFVAVTLFATLLAGGRPVAAQDPLPSWNAAGEQKCDRRVRHRGHPARRTGFCAARRAHCGVRQRRHLVAGATDVRPTCFALDRVKALAPQHPEWKDKQPFKAVLEGDMKAVAEAGEQGWWNSSWRPMPA